MQENLNFFARLRVFNCTYTCIAQATWILPFYCYVLLIFVLTHYRMDCKKLVQNLFYPHKFANLSLIDGMVGAMIKFI